VKDLYRYPIKGLSAQPEASFDIVAGDGLPMDRRFALALGTTRFDPQAPEPLDKGYFLMLRRDTALAALRTRYDVATGRLVIGKPDGTIFEADLGTVDGRAATEEFFLDYLGAACEGRPRLVEAEGHKFTDVSVVSPAMMRALSVVNLASVRDLSDRMALDLHPLRFRANIYVDGLAAWEEFAWVGREVVIGTARFKCVLRTKRCAAVDVDPVTARRDVSIPKSLMKSYGHPDCGVYLEVLEGGAMRRGDTLSVSPAR
jgi:uncharacterized protein YcbX